MMILLLLLLCIHSPLSEVLENEGIVEEDDYMYPGCQLRRNTAVGTVTGLEVFLYPTNMSESLGLGQRDIDGARVRTKYAKSKCLLLKMVKPM